MSQADPDHLITRLQGIQARVAGAAQDQQSALKALEQLVFRVLNLEQKIKTLEPKASEPCTPGDNETLTFKWVQIEGCWRGTRPHYDCILRKGKDTRGNPIWLLNTGEFPRVARYTGDVWPVEGNKVKLLMEDIKAHSEARHTLGHHLRWTAEDERGEE